MADLSKRKIVLHVDSDPTSKTLKTILRLNGYDAAHVYTAAEAIVWCRLNLPDAVIIALPLDSAEGISLVSLILDIHPATKVLLLGDAITVSDPSVGKRLRGENLAIPILSKPVDIQQILDFLAAVLAFATGTKKNAELPLRASCLGKYAFMMASGTLQPRPASMSILSFATMLVSLMAIGPSCPVFAQVNTGELRLRVTDAAGLGIKASVTVSSEGNHYRSLFTTGDAGETDIKILPYGIYLVHVEKEGFTENTRTVEVRSAIPAEQLITLALAPVKTSVDVSSAPLIDPHRTSSVMQIGSEQIRTRAGSLPGRSVQDLVSSQPGWLYEGNAVLHPRGSEYQTQFVIDGIPLTDNRSPGFGPEIEADNLESVSVYTSGFPAEYGRKMGGVVELNTSRETDARSARTSGLRRR